MTSRIFLAGHRGMVGSAIYRALRLRGVPKEDILTRDRTSLELTDQAAVRDFFKTHKPETVILAAARVGGIHANSAYPASFLYDNLMIEANVIQAAHLAGVERLLFLGSSCIYPKAADQPMSENALLGGPLEPTNEAYAIAKIAGIKLCEGYNRQYGNDYRSVMPTNLYGPGDNFHPDNSHVLPALIRKFHEAKVYGRDEVVIWGTGTPRREFLHVDDMAEACLFVLGLDSRRYAEATDPMLSHINIGVGTDISIRELAGLVAEITGFRGRISCDPSKPDGARRKLMDVSKLSSLGWTAQIGLRPGIEATYRWFQENMNEIRV